MKNRIILTTTITLVLLLFTFNSFAEELLEEYIDKLTKQICAESNLFLDLQGIKEILDLFGLSNEGSKTKTCNVWESSYYTSLESSPFVTNDAYSGPILLIKMISDGGKGVITGLDHTIIGLREDMVCVKRDGEMIFIAYNLEASNSQSFLDDLQKTLSSGAKTHIRKSLFQFEGDKLVWAGQVIKETSSTISNLKFSSNFFRCGNTIL